MKRKNRKAPDSLVALSDGTQRKLSSFWQQGRLVLVFVRHFG
jgi:hypothetical protein